ncbi:MAG: right-handed parallel beta-helix repeat-containing protein [Deltaproteobacteria bacterium]|nr:right-handed parallel beta-helix repeat-containing protein [Deltaproteobacteria bacterium]
MSEFVRIIDPSGKTLRNDLYNSPPDTASYIIFKEGNLIKAKNGNTGQIEYKGSDALTVINNAAADLSDGGRIYIRKGTYDIGDGTIKIYDNTVLCGDGPSTLIVQSSSTDNPVISNVDRTNGNSNLKVCDIQVKNTAPFAGPDQVCLEFEKCNNVFVQNVYIQSVYDGIEFCRSDNCTALGCHVTALEGNTDPFGTGIEFDHMDGGNYHKVAYNYIYGFPNGILSDANQHYCIVIGNTILSSLYYGIFMQILEKTPVPSHIAIIGNVILNTQTYDAIRLEHGSANFIIAGNIARNNKLHGCRIYGGESVTIIGNIFCENWYGVKLEGHEGYNTQNIVIEDNILLNNSHGAINITGTPAPTNYTIRNNIGFPTESSGIATIPSGQTSVTVAHGLAGTPTSVVLGPTHAEVVDAVWSADDTNIIITVPSAVSADRQIAWYAEYKP